MKTWIEVKRDGYLKHLAEETLPSLAMLPERLYQAFSYALVPHGKLIRPMLFQAALDHPHPGQWVVGQSLELLHTYTLVHDDLPCIDNDDIRRNQPSLHIAFDEATALLVGDGLQSFAFEHIVKSTLLTDQEKVGMMKEFSACAGPRGMIAGQYQDLMDHVGTLEALQNIYHKKTGQLFQACLTAANLLNHTPDARYPDIGAKLGQLFQILDDLDDDAPPANQPHLLHVMNRSTAINFAKKYLTAWKEDLRDLSDPLQRFLLHLANEWEVRLSEA
jgi:geranylgeranyl pyrophosphate synthase